MQTLLPVPVVDDVTASKVGPPPPVRPHRHDHVIARCQHRQVHLRRRPVRDDDVVGRLELSPAPADIIRNEDEDDVIVLLTHVVHGLADVGGRGGVVALRDATHSQEVAPSDVDPDSGLVVARPSGIPLQQIGSGVLHAAQEGELSQDCPANEVEVSPRLQILQQSDVFQGQAFENGVAGGEIPLVHHPEAFVGSVSEASHLEDATERGGGSVERRPPAVHLGDAQQRGLLEHPVA